MRAQVTKTENALSLLDVGEQVNNRNYVSIASAWPSTNSDKWIKRFATVCSPFVSLSLSLKNPYFHKVPS